MEKPINGQPEFADGPPSSENLREAIIHNRYRAWEDQPYDESKGYVNEYKKEEKPAWQEKN